MKILYIFGTIIFTVFGQLIIKWQMSKHQDLPALFFEKVLYLFMLFLNPWILTGFIFAFLAALCWMAAMTKFQLSYAYPFMGLNFVLVFIFSNVLFKEPVSFTKVIGLALIVLGIIVSSRSI